MNKVVVLGCPGSGKSTFTKQLSLKTSIPAVHLDFFYHQKEYNYYDNKAAWVNLVSKLIQQPRWIMDGNYQSTIPMRCEAADMIILFDLPRRVCAYRALKRRVKFRNKHRSEMPSEWSEKADSQFLKYLWTFRKNKIPLIYEEISKYPNKRVVVFKNSSEATGFLQEQ